MVALYICLPAFPWSGINSPYPACPRSAGKKNDMRKYGGHVNSTGLLFPVILAHEFKGSTGICIGKILIRHPHQTYFQHPLRCCILLNHFIHIGYKVHDPFRCTPVSNTLPTRSHKSFTGELVAGGTLDIVNVLSLRYHFFIERMGEFYILEFTDTLRIACLRCSSTVA